MITLRERLELKAEVANQLYAEGRITKAECFRHGVDIAVQQDSGPIELITDRLVLTPGLM